MDHMGYRDYVGQAIAAANLFPNVFLGTHPRQRRAGHSPSRRCVRWGRIELSMAQTQSPPTQTWQLPA